MKVYTVLFALVLSWVESTTALPTNGHADLQTHLLQLEQTVSGLQSHIQVQDQKYAAVLSSVLSKLTTTTTELTDVKTELGSVKTDLGNVTGDLDSAKRELSSVKTELSNSKTELSSVQTKLTTAETNLSIVNTHFDTLKNDHRSLQTEFSDLKTRFKVQEAETLHMSTDLNSSETKLASAMSSIDGFTRDMNATHTDSRCDVDAMERRLNNSDANCPSGFIKLGSSCYLFSRIAVSFADANSYCIYFSSHLAIVTSKEEDDFLRGYLHRHGDDDDKHFIGGSDLRMENSWTWLCSERNMAYTGWGHHGHHYHDTDDDGGGGGESCLVLAGNDPVKWEGTDCRDDNKFICERKL